MFECGTSINKKKYTHHPLEKYIKSAYLDRKIYIHNSIHNPQYPKKKERLLSKNRVKFTIIGNRVSREFLECRQLVTALYKYRWNNFEAPVARGVTSFEWPLVLNDIKIRYGGLAHCLVGQAAVLFNNQFLGGEKELKEYVKTQYIYHVPINHNKLGTEEFYNFIKGSERPCVYMHISVDKEYIGTFIFMLYVDVVPLTCMNFIRLCEEKKGGYSGTPIHRIVKDGWIQAGGFGLKSVQMECENYIIPKDRRGVLCMANDGRHCDNSTQFFVLLQPAEWMAYKYVALGQLIDGNETLKKIENVQTWCEDPKQNIIIGQAGLLNMDTQDLCVNRNADEYLEKHIEDLILVGEYFLGVLMDRVYIAIECLEITRLEPVPGEGAEQVEDESIKQEPEKTENEIKPNECEMSAEDDSSYVSPVTYHSVSKDLNPKKPFYLALTDAPYPGEVSSVFDLKRFLQGSYCLESDLTPNPRSKKVSRTTRSFFSYLIGITDSNSTSTISLDSDEEIEIKKYLRANVDQISFAGNVIRGIALTAAKASMVEEAEKFELLTEEELIRFKRVLIDDPETDEDSMPTKVRRRQTGFVRGNIERASTLSSISICSTTGPFKKKEVRIAPSVKTSPTTSLSRFRRATGVVPKYVDPSESYSDTRRPSTLAKLYDDSHTYDNLGPTLKDYKPLSFEGTQKNTFLTRSPISKIQPENSKDRFTSQSATGDKESFEQMMSIQHGKKLARKISSDYVKTMDVVTNKQELSIRSVEYAKRRPTLTVQEYHAQISRNPLN